MKIKKCYKLNKAAPSPNNTTFSYTISSIKFNFYQSGDLIICLTFINSTNENIFFTKEHMCQDWSLSKHHHSYKPLFVVLMYLVCIAVFVSTVLFHYCGAKHIETGKRRKMIREQRLFKCNQDPTEVMSNNIN